MTSGHPYHSPNLHPGPCSSVGMWRGTDRHTEGHDQYTFRLHLVQNVIILCALMALVRYGDSTVNTVEENSGIFSSIRMRWLPSVL